MKIFTRWARHEHSIAHRILATLPAGILFVFLIPYGLIRLGPKTDNLLHIPTLSFGMINYVLGGCIILLGFTFAFWSILSQFTRASGTPLPMMPTQKLLIDGPFRYSRNPMSFGTICMYTGIGITAGSISSIVMAFILAALLYMYLKHIEEKELEIRFGQEYLDYKEKTPFFFPRIFRR